MKVLAIATRAKSRAPMLEHQAIRVTQESGLEGDSRGKPNSRQVTLLSERQWQQACDVVSVALPWTYRRANILVSDIEFSADMVGKEVQIGTLVLKITGETDPCPRMDEQHQGLTEALQPDWRGGVCCRVIADGDIAVSSPVELR